MVSVCDSFLKFTMPLVCIFRMVLVQLLSFSLSLVYVFITVSVRITPQLIIWVFSEWALGCHCPSVLFCVIHPMGVFRTVLCDFFHNYVSWVCWEWSLCDLLSFSFILFVCSEWSLCDSSLSNVSWMCSEWYLWRFRIDFVCSEWSLCDSSLNSVMWVGCVQNK